MQPIHPTFPRLALALAVLALLNACVAPSGTRIATQLPTQQSTATTTTVAARAAEEAVQPTETSSASMPADYTPQPVPIEGSIPPTWTPAPPLPTEQAQPAATAQSGTSQLVPTGAQRATVVRVVDGDTVSVEIDGQEETVRFIGIDTPETKHPSKGVECYGKEASARTAELLDSQTVYLEEDQSQDSRDRFGRILRYVWLEDGTNVNMRLVAQGYAFEYTFETPYKYQADFRAAQDEARAAGLGLWAASACNGEQKPAGVTGTSGQPTAPPEQSSGPTATPAPTEQVVAPTVAAVQPPASTVQFNGCEVDPGVGSAPDAPVQIVEIDKRAETVTLKNVGAEAVDLAGWTMCSIKGGQQHTIGGTLGAGEEKTFENTGGNIWNNSERDGGALYDGEGRLVSYWGG